MSDSQDDGSTNLRFEKKSTLPLYSSREWNAHDTTLTNKPIRSSGRAMRSGIVSGYINKRGEPETVLARLF